MGNFSGWTFAVVNAIASEVANIQLRFCRVAGEDHEELDDHEIRLPGRRKQPDRLAKRHPAA